MITEDQIKGAPKYAQEDEWNWGDAGRNRAVKDYYGVPMI
jgi:hypothetical protein